MLFEICDADVNLELVLVMRQFAARLAVIWVQLVPDDGVSWPAELPF